jgi:hypothetical protein
LDPDSGARRELITADAVALDPHAVADAQAIEVGLHHGLIVSVVESNADEIDVLPFVRLPDFVADQCTTYCATTVATTRGLLLQMRDVRAEETEQSDDDQVDGNDIVQHARHNQDENAGDKRYKRTDAHGDVHFCSP